MTTLLITEERRQLSERVLRLGTGREQRNRVWVGIAHLLSVIPQLFFFWRKIIVLIFVFILYLIT